MQLQLEEVTSSLSVDPHTLQSREQALSTRITAIEIDRHLQYHA